MMRVCAGPGGWLAAMKRIPVAAVLALLLLLPGHAIGQTGYILIALRSDNGKWVGAEYGASSNNGYLNATKNVPLAWELFHLYPLGGGYYGLRSKATNKWVAADPGIQGGLLIANRTSAGPWEKFQVFHQGGNSFALKANSTGKYVAADYNLGGPLIANRGSIGPWEKFGFFLIQGKCYVGGGNILTECPVALYALP